jgi:DnaJ-class molecular chaperone
MTNTILESDEGQVMDNEKCKNCKGTGKQVFHGAFESAMGMCNFCKGSGKYEDYKNWFKKK